LLGIGHPLRGDDAAGLLFVRLLLKNIKLKHPHISRRIALFKEMALSEKLSLLLIEGGASPENYTGLIRRFKPELLIIVDAADMKASPGTVKVVRGEKIASLYGTTTHRMPPALMVRYLALENPELSTSWIVVQPEKVPLLSRKISRAVRLGVDEFVCFFTNALV
jgi:hydrogenase maturation protease